MPFFAAHSVKAPNLCSKEMGGLVQEFLQLDETKAVATCKAIEILSEPLNHAALAVHAPDATTFSC